MAAGGSQAGRGRLERPGEGTGGLGLASTRRGAWASSIPGQTGAVLGGESREAGAVGRGS